MFIVYLLLLIGAAVCFGIAAFVTPRPNRPASHTSFLALGALLWVLVPLIHALTHIAG